MGIPKGLRSVLRRIVPDRLRTYRGDRWRRSVDRATALTWSVTGGVVRTGPFAGLRYVRTEYSQLGPKLLGTYERELDHLVRRVIEADEARVVNVGAAEGYYAVGLLARTQRLRVTAFEQNADARTFMTRLAELNGVADRLEVLGHCAPGDLAASLSGAPPRARWVLMDVEGAERDLLDPSLIPGLRGVEILVETHDFLDPGITDELVGRFRPTHEVTRIPALERTRRSVPAIAGMHPADVVLAAFERSPEDQAWLHMVPRAGQVPSPTQ